MQADLLRSDARLPDLLEAALAAARSYLQAATNEVEGRVSENGSLVPALADRHQRALHGLAWAACLVETLAATREWVLDRIERGRFDETDSLAVRIGFGEYLAQLVHGIVMSQAEIARPADLGVEKAAAVLAADAAVRTLMRDGNTAVNRAALVAALDNGGIPDSDLGDETNDIIRAQFRRFARDKIAPNAHRWHLADELIPDEIISEMASMGTFGICIDPEYGGLGLSKLVMCIVTEELSRAWITAGSLGTRSEIAGDLIISSGTEAQKQTWLPRIASGEVLPTAVFTEPNTGSDLASISTRASRDAQGWKITGNKTWITHAARSDLMAIMARTEPGELGYKGLSIFLASKPRRKGSDDFPLPGLTGTEIPVLGYRGMKEYELSFDGFQLPPDSVLGGETGAGFRQLMRTFEGARIQTAARAVGVSFNALELGLRYAKERQQFGRPIIAFPRVADKLALIYVETVLARELTYAAARAKDEGARCDIEAGMAKLLAARTAWSSADCALQIHGGNGYALEYDISRVLCDARILNVFEGAGEIQAHVIGRGLIVRSANRQR